MGSIGHSVRRDDSQLANNFRLHLALVGFGVIIVSFNSSSIFSSVFILVWRIVGVGLIIDFPVLYSLLVFSYPDFER